MLRKLSYYVKIPGILLITVALIVGMVACEEQPVYIPEIRDWYDLDAVRDNLGGSYILMNDLDSTTEGYEELASETANEGNGWQPIGAFIDQMVDHGFLGFMDTFDGQGYEIRDLFINRPNQSYVGLFLGVGQEGVIKDIGTVNAIVIGNVGVGTLSGWNRGTVSNSYSTGNVTGNGELVGGLVGLNLGTMSNSYATGSVTGQSSIGGLTGVNGGIVKNSYATASVTGNGELVGGLVGLNDGGTVSDSYAAGSVTGFSLVGGLVGDNWGMVSGSFWDTQTSGQATSDGGTGKATFRMKKITTFSGTGWDIVAVANPGTRDPSYTWNIVDYETYPFLSWQT